MCFKQFNPTLIVVLILILVPKAKVNKNMRNNSINFCYKFTLVMKENLLSKDISFDA